MPNSFSGIISIPSPAKWSGRALRHSIHAICPARSSSDLMLFSSSFYPGSAPIPVPRSWWFPHKYAISCTRWQSPPPRSGVGRIWTGTPWPPPLSLARRPRQASPWELRCKPWQWYPAVPASALPYPLSFRWSGHSPARRRGSLQSAPPYWYKYCCRRNAAGSQWGCTPALPGSMTPTGSTKLHVRMNKYFLYLYVTLYHSWINNQTLSVYRFHNLPDILLSSSAIIKAKGDVNMKVIPGMCFGHLTTKWNWKNHTCRKVWKCTCDCGGYCYVKEDALIKGIVKDCGSGCHETT